MLRIRRAGAGILTCLAIWLLFEAWVSWAAFCHQPEEYGSAYQAAEKYECVFKGPVISLLRVFAKWWGDIFDKPDAYVALFTLLLFVSTVALWWATRGLLWVTNETVKLARE